MRSGELCEALKMRNWVERQDGQSMVGFGERYNILEQRVARAVLSSISWAHAKSYLLVSELSTNTVTSASLYEVIPIQQSWSHAHPCHFSFPRAQRDCLFCADFDKSKHQDTVHFSTLPYTPTFVEIKIVIFELIHF